MGHEFLEGLNEGRGEGSDPVNIDVINQANFPIKAGCGENGVFRDLGDGLQGFGVDEFQVVDGEALRGVVQQMGFGAPEVNGGVLFSGDGQVFCGRESAADPRGVLAFFRGETNITGREGQAIGLTDSRVSGDFDGNIQIPNHALDEGDLLEVLVSKNGVGRLKKIEQLQDDGEDSVKMAGPARSAKVLGEERFGDENRVIGVVEEFFFRGEGEIDPFFFAEGEVGLERAGVVGQIGDAIELDGIDEDRDGNRSGGADQLAGMANQSQMSLVEGSHCRDQGEGSGQVASHLCNAFDFRSDFDHVGNVVISGKNSTRNLVKSPAGPRDGHPGWGNSFSVRRRNHRKNTNPKPVVDVARGILHKTPSKLHFKES